MRAMATGPSGARPRLVCTLALMTGCSEGESAAPCFEARLDPLRRLGRVAHLDGGRREPFTECRGFGAERMHGGVAAVPGLALPHRRALPQLLAG